MRSLLPVLFLCLLFSLFAIVMVQSDEPSSAESQPVFLGKWIGSRLQCRKDESGPVRCGTPAPFSIDFRPDSTGSAQGEGFPAEFSWEDKGEGKLLIVSTSDKSKTWEIFDVKVDSEFISFQCYFYPEAGKEVGEDYIHFIFDLSRE